MNRFTQNRLTQLFSSKSDQLEVSMRKTSKRSVKSTPGYMQLLKDLDDSEYHNWSIQKYSKTIRYIYTIETHVSVRSVLNNIVIHLFLCQNDYLFSDENFFEDVAITPTAVIKASDKTCKNAENVLQEFFEISPSQRCRDTVADAHKKKESMAVFKKRLQESRQLGQDWRDWKFSVQIKVTIDKKSRENPVELDIEKTDDKPAEHGVNKSEEKTTKLDVEINLIQAAVIKRNIEQVKIITGLAFNDGGQADLDAILTQEMKCSIPNEWNLSPKYSWISDATVIHLATCWHMESLIHFLDISPLLCNHVTSQSKCTPLHVASSCNDDTVVIKILIGNKAQIGAKNASDQTPLHLASQFGLTNDVITLLFEGNADVMALDSNNLTPLHLAKTSVILDILLAKTDADKVNLLTEGKENCLYKHIVKNHPESIKTFLDLLVTESNSDHYVFHLDMFQHNTDKKHNYLNKHQILIDEKQPEMLRHPIMVFFTDMKWYPHKKLYYSNFTIFLVFLLSFTLHAIYCVKFLQCDCLKVVADPKKCNDTFGDLMLNETKCKKDLEPMHTITKYISWSFLGILTGVEILQFLTKLLNAVLEKSIYELWEYFSKQNMCEVLMLVLGQAFFAFQYREGLDGRFLGYRLQDDFLGWTLFFAWTDLTIFLGRFDIFGKHIYRSWHVMKNVAFSMVVYIPAMVAFAAAFHCFLMYNDTFEGPVASFFKVLTMILGEFDFEDNFVYDKVDEVKGSKWSVQIMLIMFIVYGSLIIANLVTAWIVITQRGADETELILAQQRIQEISGIPSFSTDLSVPSKLCISQTQARENPSFILRKWYEFKSYLADDNTGEVWSIKEHSNENCEKSPLVPSYTRVLTQLTISMMKAKKDKEKELIKTIKENRKQNENKLKELMAMKEQTEPTACQCHNIPVGYELQSMVLKSPTGIEMTLKVQEEPLHE